MDKKDNTTKGRAGGGGGGGERNKICDDDGEVGSCLSTSKESNAGSSMYKTVRVKRKRLESPLETLIVDEGLARLRKTRKKSILSAMSGMSLSKQGTGSSKNGGGGGAAAALATAAAVEGRKTRKKKRSRRPEEDGEEEEEARRKENDGKRVRLVYERVKTVDPQKKKRHQTDRTENDTVDEKSSVLDRRGFARTKVPVLNEDEIVMDKAVWSAFQSGNFVELYGLIAHGKGSINYQRRASDMTTCLMAAARHGKRDVCEEFLRIGANASLKSKLGDTAATIAGKHGHRELGAWLKKHEAPSDEDDEFVYDIYRVSNVACADAPVVTMTGGDGSRRSILGTVCGRQVDACVDEDIYGAGYVDFEDGDDEGGYDDDEDSNAEDWHGNDYPDEERSSGDEAGGNGGDDDDDWF
eukprot:g325.t1